MTLVRISAGVALAIAGTGLLLYLVAWLPDEINGSGHLAAIMFHGLRLVALGAIVAGSSYGYRHWRRG